MFRIIVVTVVLFGCSSKKENEIYGVWKSENKVLFIEEFGKGVKIELKGPKEESSVFTGVYEDGLLKVDLESNTLNIPINQDRLIFKGSEYRYVLSADELNRPKNLEELSRGIVNAVKLRLPEVLKFYYPDEEHLKILKENCHSQTLNQIYNPLYSSLRYFEDEIKYLKVDASKLEYDSYKLSAHQVSLNLDSEPLECNSDAYEKTGQLQITCKLDDDVFFIFIPACILFRDGNVSLFASIQVSNSGRPLKDKSTGDFSLSDMELRSKDSLGNIHDKLDSIKRMEEYMKEKPPEN